MPRRLRLSAWSVAAPGHPRQGGALRFAVGDQGCGDAQQGCSNDSRTDQDPASGELKPWLATSWTCNADVDEPVGVVR